MTFDEPDRIGKFFADSGRVASFDEADALLQSFAVDVRVGDALNEAQQIFLYTFINIAQRCFRGGIFLSGELAAANTVPMFAGDTLADVSRTLGAVIGRAAPTGSPNVVIKNAIPADSDIVFYPTFGHWWGGVSREPPSQDSRSGALGAVLSAGLVTSALFTFFERERAPHCVRTQFVCLWTDCADFGVPDSDGPEVAFLPTQMWLLGLGHLGQAYAWLIGLLPYPVGHDGCVIVQDDQMLATENYGTSVLYRDDKNLRKTDAAKAWLDRAGFNVFRIERRIGANFRREAADSTIALAGFDNGPARRWASEAGFDLLLDGGIGATVRSFSSIQVTTLPGPTSAAELWPNTKNESNVPDTAAYIDLQAAGVDRCGLAQIAGRAVAAPFVGTVTACAVIAQLLRPLHGQHLLHRWSYDVRSPLSLSTVRNSDSDIGVKGIPFCEARVYQSVTSSGYA
tara:strand:+ start:236 stop:1600 length:1365 start_codon:yes stop_codon:yes gene_type:complete